MRAACGEVDEERLKRGDHGILIAWLAFGLGKARAKFDLYGRLYVHVLTKVVDWMISSYCSAEILIMIEMHGLSISC